MKPQLNWLYLAFFTIALASCATTQIPQTPQQIAQGFWDATVAQNISKAREFTSKTYTPMPDKKISTWQNATLSFGTVHINENDAWVDTTVNFTDNDKPVSLAFTTVLKTEGSGWKVDHQKTMTNFKAQRNTLDNKEHTAKELEKKLRKLGDQLSKDLDKATTELKKQMPEIKKDMQSLGKNINKELNDVLKEFGPAIKNNLQDFAEAINKAIEDAKKKKEQEKNLNPEPSVKSI